MPNCDLIDPLVTPFVDETLSDAERRLVEIHLLQCPPCHSRVSAEREVHRLMHRQRAGLCRESAPDSLHAACTGLARAAARHPEEVAAGAAPRGAVGGAPVSMPLSSWRARVTPYALAASLVLGVGGAFLYQATDKSARVMAAELTADHVKCFAMNGVLGTHDETEAVESSMLASFDWRMHLPSEPARAGLELVGSRPCIYAEGKIAHIMYRHDGHPVSLFMLPKTARTQQLVEVFGHEAAVWCAGERTFVLIAREPRQDVERLAAYVRASMH
jgi:anti-sigma factor RsiW